MVSFLNIFFYKFDYHSVLVLFRHFRLQPPLVECVVGVDGLCGGADAGYLPAVSGSEQTGQSRDTHVSVKTPLSP